jgi:ATP-binding cassette subfamily B protein
LPKINIKQHDVTDCGAACLASVAAHYKLQIPIARIRQYANTDKKGTNVLGMIEAAERLGFQAKGVKGVVESLSKIPKPAIAHVAKKEGLLHYVVIYGVTDKHVTVMDPGIGKTEKLKLSDFLKEWTGVLILLLPTEQFEVGNQKISTFQRFWHLLRPHTSVMLQALVGAAVYTILGLSTSIYIQKITDNVIVEGNKNLLNLLSLGMILLLLLQVVLGAVKSVFALKTGQSIDARLILGYYKHLLKLPQQFFDTMRVGEIISRVNDAVKIRVFINDVLISLAVNIFIVVFSFGMMFTYYWKLALLMLAIIPFYVVIYFIVNRINKKQQRAMMESSAELESQLVESLNSIATIKRFGIEDMTNIKTENRFVVLLRTIYQASISSLYIGSTSEFITRLLTIVLLWVGTYFVIEQELTPGELLSFYSLVGYFTGPIQSLIGTNKTIQEALIAADRLFEIIDLERETEGNKMTLTPEMVGNIRFENVNFRYGTRVQVFENLTLTIQKGEITAIIGESGSGKSTLMYLLQNLYSLTSGSIFIGNYDIKHISSQSLRKIVSVVPQQIDLLSGSLLENISLGDFNPNMQCIIEISNLLGNSAFIEKLPNGFNTRLGEHGTNISGGQRQRIAIARALYRNPEILILDEATSALDVISEKNIQNAIEFLRNQGKTIIIIAHRLSTIKSADKILVLENGKLVQEGNHQSLLYQEGVYNRLWMQQFEGIL